METNHKFLKYKTYSKFEEALQNNLIHEDSIVFVEDRRIIYAKGKEYGVPLCDWNDLAALVTELKTYKENDELKLNIVFLSESALSQTESEGGASDNKNVYVITQSDNK